MLRTRVYILALTYNPAQYDLGVKVSSNNPIPSPVCPLGSPYTPKKTLPRESWGNLLFLDIFYGAGNPLAPDFSKKRNFASEALTELYSLCKMIARVDLGLTDDGSNTVCPFV